MKKIYITITIILLLFGSYNVVNALTQGELEQKRLELKEKIEEAGKNIENIEVELTDTLQAINALDEEIYLYEEQINEISNELSNIEIQINETEKMLEEIEKKYEYQLRFTRKKVSIRI